MPQQPMEQAYHWLRAALAALEDATVPEYGLEPIKYGIVVGLLKAAAGMLYHVENILVSEGVHEAPDFPSDDGPRAP